MWTKLARHRSTRRWQSSLTLNPDSSIHGTARELYGRMCRSLNIIKKNEPLRLRRLPPTWVSNDLRTAKDASIEQPIANDNYVRTLSSAVSIQGNVENTVLLDPLSLSATLIQKDHETAEQPILLQPFFESEPDEKQVLMDQRSLSSRLYFLIHKKKDPRLGLHTLREMISKGLSAHHTHVKQLFKLLVAHPRPFEAYEVLCYYRAIPTSIEYLNGDGDICEFKWFYERLCYSMRVLGHDGRKKHETYELVEAVAKDLTGLDRDGRAICYPNFVASMMEQRWSHIGVDFTGPFYQRIVEEELDVKAGWWYHILSKSKRNRQADLPIADVVDRLVFQFGIRPVPYVILLALDNLYPFTNMEYVEIFLQALLHLQNESNNNDSLDDDYRYEVDVAVLDSITAMAAQQGNVEVCLLACEYLESLGYEASQGMLENTICAFTSNPFTYQQGFSLLSSMEKSGYSMQLSLLRSMSAHLRIRASNCKLAHEVIRQLALEGSSASVEMLNTLLSAAAERGDIGRTVSIFLEFDQHGLKPNIDSFTFVFEALGKHIRSKSLPRDQMIVAPKRDALIITAASFVDRMEQHGVTANTNFYRNYIEFLVVADQEEKATSIVLGARDSGITLDSKSIYRVAMANAKKKRFDIAREIARVPTVVSDVLIQNLERLEGLHQIAMADASNPVQEDAGESPAPDSNADTSDDAF